MSRKLSEQRGEIALRGAIILIGFILVLLAVLQGLHVYRTVSNIKEKTNEAVLAALAGNISNVYEGLRESDWKSRQSSDLGWTVSVDASQVLQLLAASTGASIEGTNTLVKEDAYQLTNLQTTYENNDGGNLSFTTTGNLQIVLQIGEILDVTIPYSLEATTTYDTKF